MSGTVKFALVFGLMLGISFESWAQGVSQQSSGVKESSISGTDDCTKVKIEVDNPGVPLTTDEKAALMDKAFYESLSRFDRCQAARLSEATAKSGQMSGGVGGDGSAGGGGDQSAPSQALRGESNEEESAHQAASSVASQSISGTLPKENTEALPEVETTLNSDASQSGADNTDAAALGSGKLPEDIPAVDNDSVLERQIRMAAMAEKDPAIREKLWNEYRKYKGLPSVKSGEASKASQP